MEFAVNAEAHDGLPAPALELVRADATNRPWTSIEDVESHRAAASQIAADAAWQSFLEVSQRFSAFRIAYCSIFKRWFDVVVASLVLILAAPLLLIAGLAIRLESSGPVLFRQQRIGRNGRSFTVLKLRSMSTPVDEAFRWYQDADGRLIHKQPNDPRVTRVGKYLRRFSIDELPQLVNVVRGEMSLIGPRPELPEIVAGYSSWQHRRHLVRPGLTGWWQIQGRSGRPMHEHTQLDLYYVNNVSFWLDVKILLRTFRIVTTGSGAF